jgi:hypothetical protein
MALTDINFQEGDRQDFVLEIPTFSHPGQLGDILIEPSSVILLAEIPGATGGGGNIFIMSE